MEKKHKTAAEMDIETILEFSEHPNYEKAIAKGHEMSLKVLQNLQNSIDHTEKGKPYLDWILLQSEFNYYVANISPNGCVLMIKRPHLKSYLAIRFGFPGDNSAAVIGNDRTIQIENIGSLKKGEGYKMMKKVIALSRKMNVLIELWTETEENVKYFERYGFVNHGPLGEHGEYSMVLPKKGVNCHERKI